MEKSFQEREKGRQEALRAFGKAHTNAKTKRHAKEKIPKLAGVAKHSLKEMVREGQKKRHQKTIKNYEAEYAEGVTQKERHKLVKKHAVDERKQKEKKASLQEKTHATAEKVIHKNKKK
jgi:hypothetical protein